MEAVLNKTKLHMLIKSSKHSCCCTSRLFNAVSLTKYKYFGYGIGFDTHGNFSHPSGGTGRNVIIFGVDMSSSTKIDNRKKDILSLGKCPTQGLEYALPTEKCIQLILLKMIKNYV